MGIVDSVSETEVSLEWGKIRNELERRSDH